MSEPSSARATSEISLRVCFLVFTTLSRGEFDNVCRAVGGWANLVDEDAKDKDTLALLRWLDESQQADKLFENQQLLRQPIVRNGRQAAVGYCPEVWEKWE